jgi:hypothetical protein
MTYGAHVVIGYLAPERIARVVSEAQGFGGRTLGISTYVSPASDVEWMVQQTADIGVARP